MDIVRSEEDQIWKVADIFMTEGAYTTSEPLQITFIKEDAVKHLMRGMSINNEWMVFAGVPENAEKLHVALYSSRDGQISISLINDLPQATIMEADLVAFSIPLSRKDAGWLAASWLCAWVSTKEDLLIVLGKMERVDATKIKQIFH